MKNTNKKILVVDDNDEARETLGDWLKIAEYRVSTAHSGAEAIKKITDDYFDLVLLDIIMPSMSGIDTLSELKRLSPKTQVIMMTAFPDVEDAMEATKKGACDYITKPFNSEELFSKINRAIEKAGITQYPNELDNILNSLVNPIRRNILKLISSRPKMRLTDITRELGINEPARVSFHLNLLKEERIIEQSAGKAYGITAEGEKVIECLRIMESYLSGQ